MKAWVKSWLMQSPLAVYYFFGARGAKDFSKRGSPRSESHNGINFNGPRLGFGARMSHAKPRNRSELESRASSLSASGSEQDAVCIIELDGCR